MISKLVVETTSLFLPVRNNTIEGANICAGPAAPATIELFDGSIGTIVTIAIGGGGSGYTIGDIITLVESGSGEQATVEVTSVTAGVIDGVTLLSGGTGYDAGSTYAVTGGTGNDDATITASTITDEGDSLWKSASLANTSVGRFSHEEGILSTKGVSVRVSGADSVAHVIVS